MGATQAKPAVITADTSAAPLVPVGDDFVMIGGKTVSVEPATNDNVLETTNDSDTLVEVVDTEIHAISPTAPDTLTTSTIGTLVSKTFDEIIDDFRAHVEAMDETNRPDTSTEPSEPSEQPVVGSQSVVYEFLPEPEPIPIEHVIVGLPESQRATEVVHPTPSHPPTPPFRPLIEMCPVDISDTDHSWFETIFDIITKAFVGMLEIPFEADHPANTIHVPSIFPVRVAQHNAIRFSLHLVYKYDNPESADFRRLDSTFSDLSGPTVYSISEVAHRYAIDLHAAEQILMELFHVTGASPHVYMNIGPYTIRGFGIGSNYIYRISDRYNTSDSWELYYSADDNDIVRYLRDIRINSTLARTCAMARAVEFL